MRISRLWEFLASRTGFLVLIPMIIVVTGIIRGGLPFSAGDGSNLSMGDAESADEPPARVAIRLIVMSEDGAYLDVAQGDANCVRRDALTGRRLHALPISRGQERWVQFTGGDGTWAEVKQQSHLEVVRHGTQLWQGPLPGQQPGETLTLCSLCLPRRRLAVASEPGSLWLLDLEAEQAVPRGRYSVGKPLVDVKLSPTGEFIVLVTAGQQYLLWDVVRGKVVTRLEFEGQSTAFASWSGNGRRLITFGGQWQRELAVWETPTGRLVQKLNHESKLVAAAELSFNGTLAAVGDGDEIRLWDVESGAKLPPLIGHQGMISALHFVDGGRTLFSGDMRGGLRRWSLSDEREIWAVP